MIPRFPTWAFIGTVACKRERFDAALSTIIDATQVEIRLKGENTPRGVVSAVSVLSNHMVPTEHRNYGVVPSLSTQVVFTQYMNPEPAVALVKELLEEPFDPEKLKSREVDDHMYLYMYPRLQLVDWCELVHEELPNLHSLVCDKHFSRKNDHDPSMDLAIF